MNQEEKGNLRVCPFSRRGLEPWPRQLLQPEDRVSFFRPHLSQPLWWAPGAASFHMQSLISSMNPSGEENKNSVGCYTVQA